jgi:N-acetylmuramoyl-L-alanine amidase
MKKILLLNFLLMIFLIQCTSDETSFTNPQFSEIYADVIIDIAHGGKDPGAMSKDGTVKEKDVVMQIGVLTFEELKKEKVTALLTRNEDIFLKLKDRVDFVDKTKSKLTLSIHIDVSDDTTKSGYRSFYQDNNLNSKLFAEEIHSELNKLNILKDNGSTSGPFYMLAGSHVPSVIIEIGYMSNKNDISIITDRSSQEKIAISIAKAIINYKKNNV